MRRKGSAKVCGGMCFRTDFTSDQPRNRHLAWRQQAISCRRRTQQRRDHGNRNRTAHLGGAVRRHALTGYVGLRRLRCEPHHLGTLRAHLVNVRLSSSGLPSLRAGHGPRKSSFLAHKAQHCSEEQQQRKPADHIVHFAVAHRTVNSRLGRSWLQICGPAQLQAKLELDNRALHRRCTLPPAPVPVPKTTHPRHPLPPDVSREHRPEPVPPHPHRLITDVDPALEQQILEIAQ